MIYDIDELSKCKVWKAVLLSLMSPTFGYLYTRRFLPLVGFCIYTIGLTAGTLATLSQFESDYKIYRIVLAAGIISGSALDNSKAILKARQDAG